MELNFKEAFTFMFKDKKFLKVYLIGTLFMVFTLLPIYSFNSTGNFSYFNYNPSLKDIGNMYLMMFISFVVSIANTGYAVTYAKSKITTNSDDLPEWTGNLSHIIFNGLKYFAGCLLFVIPLYLILYIISLIIAIIFVIIGIFIMSILGISVNSPDFLTFMIVMGIIGLFISLPILTAFVMSVQIGTSSFLADLKPLSFYNFRRIRNISKKNLLNSFVIIVFSIVWGIILFALNFLSVYLYYILAAVFGFYFMLIFWNLMAQYAQIGMKKHLERIETNKQATDEN